MKYLITGASGFVGCSLSEELMRKGVTVRAVYRNVTPRNGNIQIAGSIHTVCTQAKYEEFSVGSIDGETDWSASLSGIDVVIHLAARVHVMHDDSTDPLEAFRRVNTVATEHLARSAAASGVKRLVYVSSIKVNGEETLEGHRYTESDSPSPQDPYGISKWEAELALHRVAQETGLEIVIVRPPLVYGAGVKGNFVQMLKILAKGIPLPLASVNNKRSLVYIGNFVDALVKCSTHPDAAGQTYLVSDGDDVSTPELLHQLGVAMECPVRLFPFQVDMLKLAARLIGKSGQVDRLVGSLQVDSSKIRRELDWQPPYTLQQGLRATAEWYRFAIAHTSKNRA